MVRIYIICVYVCICLPSLFVVQESPNLDHTYYSIEAGHIYHTLDPATGGQCHPPTAATSSGTGGGGGRLYINRNLDLLETGNGGGAAGGIKATRICLVPPPDQQRPGGGVGVVAVNASGGISASPQLFQITPPPSFSLGMQSKMNKGGGTVAENAV